MRTSSRRSGSTVTSGPSRASGTVFCLVFLLALPFFLISGRADLLAAGKKQSSVRHEPKIASQHAGTFKVVVREVVVDVVVTGPKGRPVKGLQKRDFEVFEDGKPEQIRAFTPHQALDLSHVAFPSIPKLPPNTFMNFSRVPSDAPLNIILLDLGNTPWDEIPYARHQIALFLKRQPLEAPYAVFVMGAGKLAMVQGFTSDKDLLMAAVDSKKTSSLRFQTTANPFKSGMGLVTVYGASSFGPEGAAADNQFGRSKAIAAMRTSVPTVSVGGVPQQFKGGGAGEGARNEYPQPSSRLAAAASEFANRTQVDNTVTELEQLAVILSGLPGRKNLFWFTGSFPFSFENLHNVSAAHGTTVIINNSSDIERAARLLQMSRAAVYAIDTQGLQVFIPTTARGEVVKAEEKRMYTEHMALDAVAKQTGGRAFYSTNGFANAMATAASEGENYYTLAYSPNNTNFNGGLRHIRVELPKTHTKYHLSYRHSYFANSFDATAWQPPDPLAFTLQHGAPEAHQILFMASLQAIGRPRPATPAEIKALTQPKRLQHQAGKGKPGKRHPLILQTYVVHYGLLPKAVTVVREHNGSRRVELEFAVRAYDGTGRELANFDSRTRGTVSRKTYRQIEQYGYRVNEKIAIPVKSAFLRLAVLDRLANRVGSMEVSIPLGRAPARKDRHAANR